MASSRKPDSQDRLPIDASPIEELQRRQEKLRALLAQIRELFPELIPLTADARAFPRAPARGRGGGAPRRPRRGRPEPRYLQLARRRDFGFDEEKFESRLLRDRLERRRALEKSAAEVAALAGELSDTVPLSHRHHPRADPGSLPPGQGPRRDGREAAGEGRESNRLLRGHRPPVGPDRQEKKKEKKEL